MALPSQLSRRERQIMDVIFELSEASAKEILERIPDPPSYSAIRATLNNLERKGFLAHRERDLKYIYFPTADPEETKRGAINRLLRTFFDGSASLAMSKLLDVSKDEVSEEELEQLQDMIEAAKKEKAKRS